MKGQHKVRPPQHARRPEVAAPTQHHDALEGLATQDLEGMAPEDQLRLGEAMGNQAALALVRAAGGASGEPADGGGDPQRAAWGGLQRPTRPLPFAAELSETFGQDLSGIRAHTDPAAVGALGAAAFTVGEDIVFPDEHPSRQTVGHELAHMLQGQGAGARGGVADHASGAEQEARELSHRAARGETTGPVRAAPSGWIHKADPADITDASGTAITQHRAPTLDDSLNGANLDLEPAATDTQMNVRILADAANPVSVSGSVPEEQLYEVVDREPVSSPEPDVFPVIQQIGTTADPAVSERLDPRAIYIGGAATAADVQQGGIGSCYLMSTLATVAAQDPSHITGAISGDAQAGITVQFFRYDAGSLTWIAAPIAVSGMLAFNVDAAGNEGGLLGAGFRVAEDPLTSDWWAEAAAGVLRVHRDDRIEGALWAPLLEKAYATYTATWGQYGGYDTATANATAGVSGYQAIEGGVANYMYLVLYGPDATLVDTDINYTPGADNVTANQDAIENLLRVMGDDVPAGDEFQMSVLLSEDSAVERLGAQIDHILGQPSSHNYRTFRVHMEKMKQEIAAWAAAPAADKEAKREPIVRRATNFATPGNWPLLHSASAPSEYIELNELCNIVMNIGTDGAPGQRHTYAWHFYSVVSASFQDAAGTDLAVTVATLPAQLASIDPHNSRVNLRNPHGGNEPNAHGRAEGPEAFDGSFSLTLDQFFRSFEAEQGAVVHT